MKLLLPVFVVVAAVSRAHASISPAKFPPPVLPIPKRAPGGTKTVIIQMFEWTWASVAAECTNFIGPAGYGFVQVSPPQEHVTGSAWWTDYQPVSYILTSKRGNQAQFSAMISACHAAGVRVIADTIFNHMAGVDSGVGVAGSSFTHYNYPGIYNTTNFHHCGLEPGDDIANYNNRLEVQTCELVNLADLATETEYVRAKLASYGNKLLSLGIDGLRLDAAKHIAATDLANITSRLVGSPYLTQEVIFGPGEPISPLEYVGIGDVQEFRYTSTLKSAFLGGGINTLQSFDNLGFVPGSGANVFVTNHDTERNGLALNYQSPSNTYVLAMIFSLAHPYGTPTILSSYSFSTTDDGAPNNGVGTCSATGGSGGWLCQHRIPSVAGMVGFRNVVGTAALVNWASPQASQIAFGRGALGFIAINNADAVWTGTFTTSLPNGVYCDVISGKSTGGACSGSTFVASAGKITASVPARSAVALHIGALGSGNATSSSMSASASASSRLPSASSASASSSASRSSTLASSSSGSSSSSSRSTVSSSTFSASSTGSPTPTPSAGSVLVRWNETATTVYGENIFLVGSISQLGNWNTAAALPLSAASYPVWTISVSLPPSTTFQYKFIRKQPNGSVTWESDPNRSATTGTGGTQVIAVSWR
ncbi:Alpha-amylase [Mycena chlorophos]|uniref:Alpha-amylase n=1 Tax=Mycena chlorophos TaxID=658473 RepID=A0A8H6WKU7_MYCCL|nr:Alpha-amylase [Mycena chlorophos]